MANWIKINVLLPTSGCFKKEGGKRLDIVLLVNGFPFVIGELKTPVRSAITWLDGAQDINEYEQSIPQMFVSMYLTLRLRKMLSLWFCVYASGEMGTLAYNR